MKILLTGGGGFLGKAIRRLSPSDIAIDWFNSKDIDLREKYQTIDLVRNSDCETVIHCASKVGGLGAHQGKHWKFLSDNLRINTNIVDACIQYNKKLIAISSVSAFPGNCPLLTEDRLEQGPVHDSEFGYALSKRILDTEIQLARNEYDANFCCLFPVNIYGPEDNFSLETGHVIPTLIHKFFLAKKHNTKVQVWGDGKSIRQFIYVDTLVQVILALLKKESLPDRIICSESMAVNISDVITILSKIADYNNIEYCYPNRNGLRVRECDNNRMLELVTNHSINTTSLSDGLYKTWIWFCDNYKNISKEV